MSLRLAIRTLAAIGLAAMTGAPSNAQAPKPLVAQRTPPRDARSPAPIGIGIIRGRVLAADGGRPLRRVQIGMTAAGLRDAQGRTTSTDEDGRYEMTDLPAGRYTVTATRGGFLPLRYGQRRPRELGRFVELADGQAVESVDFALQKMSVISGRITDEDGEPIAGATVLALRPIYLAGHRQLAPTSDASVRTDDVGEYRIGGLVPGTYVVSARSGDKWVIDVGGPEETMGYSPTYFPGTTNVADARRISVGLGAEAKATDFSLLPGRAATVSGTAFDSHGRPFPSVNLALEVRSEAGGFFGTAGNARVGADGTFTFHDVAPGAYKLTASRTDSDPEVAILPIVVDGTDISSVALTGSAGGTVSGHVVLADGVTAKMPRVQISIVERLLGQPDPMMLGTFRGRYTPIVPAAEDGSFVVSHVFGPARLDVTVPDGWMVKAIVRDGRDIADTPLEMQSGEQLSGVQISLTDRVTSVEGTLGDDNGAPVADGTVVVFATDSGKWSEESRFVRAARADQKGRYQIKGLPPGDYLAIAIDYVEDGAWNEPEFLESLRQYAQRVTLDAVEPQSLSLKVRSAP
jgi:protocatechuate 3,4-dioxygenase beta subunit